MTSSLHPVAGTARALHGALAQWLAVSGEPAPLIVRTSGSSGHPKDVVLSRSALLASVAATHTRLGGGGQWLLALPPQGVAGLQVLIRSIVAGFEPVYSEEFNSFDEARTSMTGEQKYVSLVPTHLYRLARADRLAELADFDAVLLGGAAVPADLLDEAKSADVHIVRSYGMSETSGGCVYDGIPLHGTQVRIGDGGQIQIAGPMLFDGYSDDPQGTADALRDGWFATNDLGEFCDGVLHVFGRMDDVVISGGVNITLPAVTEILLRCDGVIDAFAVGVEDHEWGQRVVACVVGDVSLQALRDAVESAGLPRSHAPRQRVCVDSLPLLPGGKVDRVALHQLAESA